MWERFIFFVIYSPDFTKKKKKKSRLTIYNPNSFSQGIAVSQVNQSGDRMETND